MLYVALVLVAAILCLARAALRADERSPWLVIGVGMVLWAGANGYYVGVVEHLASPPYPSLADGLWLSAYASLFVGLMLLMRSQLRGFRSALWIDALVGVLAFGSVGAALLVDPISASTGGSVAAVATSLAYPLADLLLLSLVVGVFALSGWRPGRRWGIICAAFGAQVVADTIYLLSVASGTYASGGPLDLVWPTVMLALAWAAWQAPGGARTLRLEGRAVVVVPSLFSLLALGLQVYDHFEPVNTIAIVLATATLVLAFGRAAMSFADLQTLARSRDLHARHQLILDATGEGVYGLDEAGRVTFVNRAALRLTGHEPHEVLGRRSHEVVHHSHADGSPFAWEECAVSAALREGSGHEVRDQVYWRKDG